MLNVTNKLNQSCQIIFSYRTNLYHLGNVCQEDTAALFDFIVVEEFHYSFNLNLRDQYHFFHLIETYFQNLMIFENLEIPLFGDTPIPTFFI